MIRTKIKDHGSFVYMRMKKHTCPTCQGKLKLVKMKKTVRARTRKAVDLGYLAAGRSVGEKTKYIWYEFKCSECGAQFRENVLRHQEKLAKKNAAAAKKSEKKEAKKAAKEAKKAVSKEILTSCGEEI